MAKKKYNTPPGCLTVVDSNKVETVITKDFYETYKDNHKWKIVDTGPDQSFDLENSQPVDKG